jgi:hypothetical protein
MQPASAGEGGGEGEGRDGRREVSSSVLTGLCPRGRVRVRADAVFTASVCKIASAGKRGRPRTSGRTFSSKNVRYDIPALYSKNQNKKM